MGTSPAEVIKWADDYARDRQRRAANAPRFQRPSNNTLGFEGRDLPVDSPVDDVVVVPESVTVINATVRGLVQNRSWNLWARDVTVTAGDQQWRFPLTVQPGELAPFEIEDWTGTTDPAAVDLVVTASLTPTVDISRAIHFGYTPQNRWPFWFTWEEYLENNYGPEWAVPEPPAGEFRFPRFSMELTPPDSHPDLEDQILNQTIADLRVYVALYNLIDLPNMGLEVLDVIELTAWDLDLNPVKQIPNPSGQTYIDVGLHAYEPLLIWAGGANQPAPQPDTPTE